MAINYPVAEMADRYTIARLKYERIESIEHLQFLEEMDYYYDELRKYEDISPFLTKLYLSNGKIWDLETEIRRGALEDKGFAWVGERAIAIRDENRIRVGIKGEIVDHYGEGFKDMKCNYSGGDE
jgi:hypothetical protein